MTKELFAAWLRAQLTAERLLELGASVFTLYGMFYGSTTPLGICLYFIGTAIWFVLTFFTKQWGLMPLNFGALFVLFHNLFKVI